MTRSPQRTLGRNGDSPTDELPAESSDRPAGEETWGGDTPTAAKLGTLAAQKDLMASLRKAQQTGGRAAQLRSENEALRASIAELRQRLENPGAPSQGSWEDREREFETILEEKSEEIRLLYMQIQELERKSDDQEEPAARGASRGNDEELNALAEELAQDKGRLDEEREQLRTEREQVRADEEDLERRMQEMELQTAKSRADLVRQRNELQRLYNEVRAELEQAKQQGGAVSDRVRNLERETQELSRAGRGR
jgi:chromosome segregation ATPase